MQRQPSHQPTPEPIGAIRRGPQVLHLATTGDLAALPLTRGLDARSDVVLETGAPGSLAARFAAEQFDCVLLPVIEAVRQPLSRVIPGIALCTRSPSRTELLYAKHEPREIRRVAVDPLAGAPALARVVLGETFNATPDFIPTPLDPFDSDTMDGLLVRGDSVWTCPNPYSKQFNLSALWADLTALPMVHLVWVARLRTPLARLRALLTRAYQQGQAGLDDIAAEAAATLRVDVAAATHHLQKEVCYTLGGQETEGIDAFIQLAAKYGLCDPDATLEFC